jgi:hypothetical protein
MEIVRSQSVLQNFVMYFCMIIEVRFLPPSLITLKGQVSLRSYFFRKAGEKSATKIVTLSALVDFENSLPDE